MGHDEHQVNDSSEETGSKVVSEGGSAAQNPVTSHGGADSVPDTPDINTEVSDAVDINESSQEGEAPEADGDEPD